MSVSSPEFMYRLPFLVARSSLAAVRTWLTQRTGAAHFDEAYARHARTVRDLALLPGLPYYRDCMPSMPTMVGVYVFFAEHDRYRFHIRPWHRSDKVREEDPDEPPTAGTSWWALAAVDREQIADPRDMVTHLVAVKQDQGFPG